MLLRDHPSGDSQDCSHVPRNAKPFLKWAGGKQRLLKQYEAYFPPHFQRYVEPFVGGGAVFFHLSNSGRRPKAVLLFDKNPELINVYRVVRDSVDELLDQLAVHQRKHDRDYYYHIRHLDRSGMALSDVEKAARTIYLNRTCYNGLYRVNGRGQFNVPMGSYKNPRIVLQNVLRASSSALQGVCLEVGEFEGAVDLGQPGDFFYFDPPYDPVSKSANFTSYTAAAFGDDDQRKLARVFAQLSEQGCYCMLSNSHTPFILELYREFRIETVQAGRAINSDAGRRGSVTEVVVLNY
jgi:DNA adenine methylase